MRDLTTASSVGAAFDGISHANEADPNRVGGEGLAAVEGRLAQGWVEQLEPEASDAVRLAARAHHLRRWEVPRSRYPDGRAGYLRWRRDQKARHAIDLRGLLDSAGVDPAVATRATTIVQKIGLGRDPEVQLFEDAVALTFLETQFAATADRLADDRMVAVVAKTLDKMSPTGRAAALTIDLDERLAALVAQALATGVGR